MAFPIRLHQDARDLSSTQTMIHVGLDLANLKSSHLVCPLHGTSAAAKEAKGTPRRNCEPKLGHEKNVNFGIHPLD